MNALVTVSRKAFNLLRRDGETGDTPRSKFNFSRDVGDGLSSNVIVAVALWVARNFPEAPVAVEDADGQIIKGHPLSQLFTNPNPWYGGGAMRSAVALDYTVQGNAYLEIGRGERTGVPMELYYQPALQIEPKGTSDELITHYVQNTATGPRTIAREDMVHFRNGLDPRDQKRGLAPLQSLLREVFTDDEAAAATAAIVRNMGIPGAIISPANPEDEIGDAKRKTIKDYFRRVFRGDNRGDALVFSTQMKVEAFAVDMSKLGLAKLRQIPEERVCAVIGIPAAVVGFGTGMEQTKVGATMKEQREQAYENVIVPMHRTTAEELDNTLLREFDEPGTSRVVYDIDDVRVLQEDENERSKRITHEYEVGLISRGEAKRELGYQAETADDEVYRQSISDVMVRAGQAPPPPPAATRQVPAWIQKAIASKQGGFEDRQRLVTRLLADFEVLSAQWTRELVRELESIGETVADAWLRADTELRASNGHIKADPAADDIDQIERVLMGLPLVAPEFVSHYARVLASTVTAIEDVMVLGVSLSDPLEKAVIAEGGVRRGLLDLTEDARRAMYQVVADAREEGLGPPDIARRLRNRVPAGPWPDPQTRALVISRTETKHGQNISSMAVYRAADSVTDVQVFDAQAGDTDEECEQINGRIFSLDDAQAVPMLAHPNCTRSFAPVVGAPVEA